MQRRSFLQHFSLGAIAAGFIPQFGWAWTTPQLNEATLVELGAPMTQIRHGALHVPAPNAIPFDWLQQIHRNIFFKNGFQASEQADLDIISVLLENQEQQEAVQIQWGAEGCQLMLEEDLLTLPRQEGFQEVPTKVLEVQLVLGSFTAGETYTYETASHQSVYVQALEGEIDCNGHLLNSQQGLALSAGEALHFTAGESGSGVLILQKVG